MRFLADLGVSLRVVEWLRSRRNDVVHLREQGLQRLPDGSIFEKASVEGRVILTFDLDFGEIVALSRGSRTSVVVFRLRNTRTGNVISSLERVLAASSDALRRGAVVIVEDGLDGQVGSHVTESARYTNTPRCDEGHIWEPHVAAGEPKASGGVEQVSEAPFLHERAKTRC